MKKIYLALPYSHRYESVKEHRLEVSRRIAKLLILQGHIVLCPVQQSYKLGLPIEWEFWEKHDISFLEWCDELWVIRLYGWDMSEGVRSEIQVAELMDKKIVFVEPDYERNIAR